MTSIVITPFDSEHAEEYKGFIENELDNADFAVDMPACVELLDVRELQQQRNQLLAALKFITNDVCDRFDMESASTNIGMKVAVRDARAAIERAESE